MKLYWFFDKKDKGSLWEIFATRSEEKAWELLAMSTYNSEKGGVGMSVTGTKEKYVLGATTDITDNEGKVATILPHEACFAIQSGFGSKKLGHLQNI